jgi:hypothetical protein
VLGHSSGAIATAVDTLVKLGEAELATDRPRRFRRAARPARSSPGGGRRGTGGCRVTIPASSRQGNLAMITVAIWHNTAVDGQGRHTAMLDGYRPGDPVVRVF